jgi:voltage-gated potassium channel
VVAGGREQENLHLLEQAGADEVIDATAAVGRMLGIATRSPAAIGVLDELLEAGSGIELTEVECELPTDTPAVPEGASLVAVIRNGRHVRPDNAGDPRPGDRLVVLNDRDYEPEA